MIFFLLVPNLLPPNGCFYQTPRFYVCLLRNWNLLCTAKALPIPLTPLSTAQSWFFTSWEFKENCCNTFWNCNLTHCINTHMKWHHLGQHLGYILSSVSHNLAASAPFSSPYVCNSSPLSLTRISKPCGCWGEESSSKAECLFSKCKRATNLAKPNCEQSVLASSG